jgi:hypothetical protein
MITLLLIACIFFFLATVLLIGVRGYTDKFESLDELSSRIEPINVEALRNLLDPAQDDYFVRHLNPRDLRWVRRHRNLVAIEYVRRIARNAAQVIRVAELATRSSSREIASAGSRIANSALRTRLLALKTLSMLWLGVVIPGRPLGVPMLQQYANLDSEVYLLSRSTRSHSA